MIKSTGINAPRNFEPPFFSNQSANRSKNWLFSLSIATDSPPRRKIPALATIDQRGEISRRLREDFLNASRISFGPPPKPGPSASFSSKVSVSISFTKTGEDFSTRLSPLAKKESTNEKTGRTHGSGAPPERLPACTFLYRSISFLAASTGNRASTFSMLASRLSSTSIPN